MHFLGSEQCFFFLLRLLKADEIIKEEMYTKQLISSKRYFFRHLIPFRNILIYFISHLFSRDENFELVSFKHFSLAKIVSYLLNTFTPSRLPPRFCLSAKIIWGESNKFRGEFYSRLGGIYFNYSTNKNII